MGKISIADVEAGMTLSEDVKEHRGMVLLAAGQQITKQNLRVFQMWGVTEVDVQGVDKNEIAEKSMAQIDPVFLRQAEEQAQDLFRHTNLKHSAINELYRMCILCIAQEKQQEQVNEK